MGPIENPSSGGQGLVLLERLCRQGRAELDVDSVAVSMLIGRTDLTPTFATDERTARLEQEISVLGEGPSTDAVRTHTRVVVPDVAGSGAVSVWPMWTQAVRGAGFGAAASFPIQQGVVVAGALALYCDAPQDFDRDRRLRAFRLADTALLALLDLAAGIAGDPLGDPLGDSLGDSPAGPEVSDELANQVLRPQVHRAAGMVMVQAGVSIDEAMVLLRTWSFRHDRTLSAVADDVVARRIRFGSDGSGSQ